MSAAILQFATQYSFYTGCLTFVLGIIGNTLNILVFTQLKLFRDNRCAFYLIIESISNLIYQLILIALTILTPIYGDDATGRSIVWCKVRYIFTQTSALTTFYMVCFSAADQYFSTNYRFNVRQMCTMKLARCLALALVSVWFLHSILFNFYFEIIPAVGCIITNSIWLQYSTYFVYPVLGAFLPVTIAASFSILAYRNVRRIIRRQIPIVRRRLDQQMTAMILMRVIIFIFVTSCYGFYRTYIINHPFSKTQPMEYAIGRLVQALLFSFGNLNYTVSFYLFVISSSRFRRQVKLVVMKKCWQRWKANCCSSHNHVGPETGETHGINVELEENS